MEQTMWGSDLKLNRKQVRTKNRLITGHCSLRKHLYNIRFYAKESICSLCYTAEEDATNAKETRFWIPGSHLKDTTHQTINYMEKQKSHPGPNETVTPMTPSRAKKHP